MKRATILFSLLFLAAAAVAQINTQSIYYWPTTGTDTYAVNITGAGTTYTGKWFKVRFVNANTGASTLAMNGGSAVALKKKSSGSWVDLSSGDIDAGDGCDVLYDGTRWQIKLTAAGSGGGTWGTITGTLSDQTDLQSALNSKQNLDSDLTTIAGLTATTDNIIQSVAGAWASRTPSQVKTALSLNNVENTALSTWAGSTNLTTLGTISTGTWQGSVIGLNYGGAGTANGILKANGSGVVSAAVANTDYLAVASPAYTGTLSTGTLGYSDTDIAFSVQKSVNSYFQGIIQNTNSGATASSDLVISSDNGTATTHYLNLGRNSSGFTGSGSFNQPGYGYLTNTSEDLLIGTTTNHGLHFATNGSTTDALTISGAGAYTFNGTTTAIHKELFPSLGITQTDGAGLWLQNATAATSGNQQLSPSIVYEGKGFETTGSTSQSVKFSTDVLPVQGTAASGTFRLRSSINGASYVTNLSLTSAGNLTLSSSAGTIIDAGASGVTTFSIPGGSQVFKVNGQGLPQLQLGATSNGFLAIDAGTTSTFGGTGFGLQYRGNGGTTGAVNAFHNMVGLAASLNSWSVTYRILRLNNQATMQPSSGAGGWINLDIVPTYNVTGTATGTIIGMNYSPTETSMTGITHYGVIVNSSTALSGFGTNAPTAKVHVKGNGTTTGEAWRIDDSGGTNRDLGLDNGTRTFTGPTFSFAGRVRNTQGADVASVAGAIAVGTDGNSFEITGTNAITLISNSSWQNGSMITLLFTSTATLTDGTANSGTDIGMELAGNANFVATADDVLTLVLSEIGGTQRWREVSRSVN